MKSSGRKALQPRNIYLSREDGLVKVKRKQCSSNPKEENHLETIVIDASLAEELSAFKKKLERLREDRERTAKLLEERDGAMDLHMTHLLQRGETQKGLEIQVDRLFRLKELHAYSSKISPIPSLRAKEQEKRKRICEFQEPITAGKPEEESSVKEDLEREIANEARADDPREESSAKKNVEREIANTPPI